MTSENNGMYMPVAPAYGGGNNGGFGFDGGAWWLLILLIALGGWGNGFGGGFGSAPAVSVDNSVQRGFDQSAIMTSLSGLNTAVTTGFGNIQSALCSGFAGVNQGVSNGFAQAEIANNARQIADMQQNFASQTAMLHGFNGLQSQLAQCCCDNRLATANLQSVIQSENCADRAAVSDGIRDVLVNQNNNTQRILDMMCQDKIDAKNEKIAELQNQLNQAAFNASQLAQNNYLQNALTAQTQYFLGLYPPTAGAAKTTGAAA